MTLRASPRDIRIGGGQTRPPILPVLLGLSLLVNAWLLWQWAPDRGDGGPITDAAVAAAERVQGSASEVAVVDGSEKTLATPSAEPLTEPPAEPDPSGDGMTAIKLTISGPVARAVTDALGSGVGDRLALTAGRLLVWFFNINKDPRKGDTLELLYDLGAGGPGDIVIHALRYTSQKMGKTLQAWRYQPAGAAQPSWYDEDGREVPGRLKDSPIRDYEQITSLIGDGRGHSGMDFKTPVGTPILMPWAGTVKRVNWNWKYNGNCLEISSGGKLVRFLHLQELDGDLKAGMKVKAGQQLAKSGNTGRSFAPHLHYEIRGNGGKVLDPLKVHGATHPILSGADLEAFEIERAALAGRLEQLAP